MRTVLEFFKLAPKIDFAKFFTNLHAEVEIESVNLRLEKLQKEASVRWSNLDEETKQMYRNFENYKKIILIHELHLHMTDCFYLGKIVEFKVDLYAMSTLISVEEIIAELKNGVHVGIYSCSSHDWRSLATSLLEAIHFRTAHYYSDPDNKEEVYRSSELCQKHKLLIDILKQLGLVEMLIEHAEIGKKAFFYNGPRSGYELKISEDMFEYIQSEHTELSQVSRRPC